MLFNQAPVRRWIAFAVAVCVTLPAVASPVQAQIFNRRTDNGTPRQGMSMKKKALMLGGAALLYYLYKKNQAKNAAQTADSAQTANAKPQLYRSKNGGIYYRDAQNRPVWLTVPSRPVRVPASEVQRYAPDYARYRGPAPVAPAGYRSQSFSQYDPSALTMPSGPRM